MFTYLSKQEGMASSSTSEIPEFILSMKVKELQSFLKDNYEAKATGKKEELRQRAFLYWSIKKSVDAKKKVNDKNSELLSKLEEEREIFDKKSLTWNDISTFPKSLIPLVKDDVISNFLTKCHYSFGDELINCGTEKPTEKGKLMYFSGKIQLCQFSQDGETLLFRANMEASMKISEFR